MSLKQNFRLKTESPKWKSKKDFLKNKTLQYKNKTLQYKNKTLQPTMNKVGCK